MARLFLILIVIVIGVVLAAVVYSAFRTLAQSGQRGLRQVAGRGEGTDMASSGIQKAAYVALIVVLFGTASGWLGGL